MSDKRTKAYAYATDLVKDRKPIRSEGGGSSPRYARLEVEGQDFTLSRAIICRIVGYLGYSEPVAHRVLAQAGLTGDGKPTAKSSTVKGWVAQGRRHQFLTRHFLGFSQLVAEGDAPKRHRWLDMVEVVGGLLADLKKAKLQNPPPAAK